MDFGSRRTVRVYVSAVLFFVFLLKMVMFFLCTAEHYSIINPVLLQKFKGYNKENGKPDESLGRQSQKRLKSESLTRSAGCNCFYIIYGKDVKAEEISITFILYR